jgi:hypothetical protein
MPQKIKGNIGEAGRILVFDESDFNTIEVNEVVGAGGAFDVTVPTSGIKMVVARSASGETIGYGAMNSVYEAPQSAEFTYGFTTPSQIGAVGAVTALNNNVGGTNSNRIALGGSTISSYYHVWFTFNNVNIRQGSTIHSAIFRTELRSDGGYGQSNTINFVAQDNPTTITSRTDYFNRPLTSNTTNFTTWAANVGTVFTWPDFATHVQQIVNRPGWESGNNMIMIIKDVDTQTKAIYLATGYGATNAGYFRPTLTINWTEHYS